MRISSWNNPELLQPLSLKITADPSHPAADNHLRPPVRRPPAKYRIAPAADEERALIDDLYGALTDNAPFTKSQLRSGLNKLVDVEMLIHWEKNVQPQRAGMWLAAAEANVAIARSIRQQVEKLLEPVGGDATQLVEFPR